MSISLLHIIVPTILILGILIFYIHSRTKGMKEEIGEIRTQLERLDNVSVVSQEPAEIKTADVDPEPDKTEPDEMIEETPADNDDLIVVEASAYNTGKSGKIYTKEELELLIKE